MAWYLLTRAALHLMDGGESLRVLHTLPTKDAIHLEEDINLIVDLEREEPPTRTVINGRSPKAEALIREFEGYHKRCSDGSCIAYPDAGYDWDMPTIGYGTTMYRAAGMQRYKRERVLKTDALTHTQALSELHAELDYIDERLADKLIAPLTQSMWDALVSYVYNMGVTGANDVLLLINGKRYSEVPAEMLKHVHSNGERFEGLMKRRKEEADLFAAEGLDPDGSAYHGH